MYSRKCDSRPTQRFLLNSSGGSVCTKAIIRGTEETSLTTVSHNLPLRGVEAKVWILTLFFWLAIAAFMLHCCQKLPTSRLHWSKEGVLSTVTTEVPSHLTCLYCDARETTDTYTRRGECCTDWSRQHALVQDVP